MDGNKKLAGCIIFITCIFAALKPIENEITLSNQVSNIITHPTYDEDYNNGICSSVDIRKTFRAYTKYLSNCRVIEGFLNLIFLDRTTQQDFSNTSFPLLTEITGYLLVYRVRGLRSIGQLFPNLAIIRGRELLGNYALTIYDVPDLREIGLHSLTEVSQGALFIEYNPMLCYVNTVDWDRIVKNSADMNRIIGNIHPLYCPVCVHFDHVSKCLKSKSTRAAYCWTNNHCQMDCSHCEGRTCMRNGTCCHSYCAGGCNGPGLDNCVACKDVVLQLNGKSRCVDKCPASFYKYKNRRCITEEECYTKSIMVDGKMIRWKPHEGECLSECPSDHQENVNPITLQPVCEKCEKGCRKVCDGGTIDFLQSMDKFRGCVHINGSLDIQLRGSHSVNVVKELEGALGSVDEISGYLKVARSVALFSLSFLRNLRIIGGSTLENYNYALIVLDNPNLMELWGPKVKLNIKNGRLFFHFNPKLCMNKIHKFIHLANITNLSNIEVSPSSNGDQISCNLTKIDASAVNITPVEAYITFTPYKHFDMRTLLGYIVNVKESPSTNVSIYDERDACNDGWVSYDVDADNVVKGTNITQKLILLKPFTQYAYYVRTVTIAAENNSGQSTLQYFLTHPSVPRAPVSFLGRSDSSSEINLQWTPPGVVNGELSHYVLSVSRIIVPDNERSYCPKSIAQIGRNGGRNATRISSLIKNRRLLRDGECVCDNVVPASSDNVTPVKQDNVVKSLIEFENNLHDTIFVKYEGIRRKRETSAEVSPDSEEVEENFKEIIIADNPEAVHVDQNSSFLKFIIPRNMSSLTIKNLTHFTGYKVELSACRKEVAEDKKKPIPPQLCSVNVLSNVQTLPLEDDEVDQIPASSVKLEVSNITKSFLGEVKVSWHEPKITNGPLISYEIEYQRLNDLVHPMFTLCVTSQQYFNNNRSYSVNMPPGTYSVRVRAISLSPSTSSKYTQAQRFTIQEFESDTNIPLIIGISTAVLILCLIIAMALAYRYYPMAWGGTMLKFINPQLVKPMDGFAEWEFPMNKLKIQHEVGSGHYGVVYFGLAQGILKHEHITKVAVKMSNKSDEEKNRNSFLHEASLMKTIDSYHVVKLLGVVTRSNPLMIMEFMEKGDLRTYLQSTRVDESGMRSRPPPNHEAMLVMAIEIADGMNYLSDKNLLHRDLAARNIMIAGDGKLKIADFGLARYVYQKDSASQSEHDSTSTTIVPDYQVVERNCESSLLPIRWMAPESIKHNVFSVYSDMWSYGIVLWEICTLADLPYPEHGPLDIENYICCGGTNVPPADGPELLCNLMLLCWNKSFKDRPTFCEIMQELKPAVKHLTHQQFYFDTDIALFKRNVDAQTREYIRSPAYGAITSPSGSEDDLLFCPYDKLQKPKLRRLRKGKSDKMLNDATQNSDDESGKTGEE